MAFVQKQRQPETSELVAGESNPRFGQLRDTSFELLYMCSQSLRDRGLDKLSDALFSLDPESVKNLKITEGNGGIRLSFSLQSQAGSQNVFMHIGKDRKISITYSEKDSKPTSIVLDGKSLSASY